MDQTTSQSKHPIAITVFHDAVAWLQDNFPDFTWDSVCCVFPVRTKKDLSEVEYTDTETGENFVKHLEDHIKALELLCNQVGQTLFVGGLRSPVDLTDACNWDAEVTDAYFQLVVYGEVIYG